MQRTDAAELAKELMSTGRNCCEAVILTADKVWNLALPPEVLEAGFLFKEGMGSGCTCGALVGTVMISGILQARYGHPLGRQLGAHLHNRFKEAFGSTCCRVLCRNRPLTEKIGKRGCKILTGHTVEILLETWEEMMDARTDHIRDHSHNE